MDGNSLDLKSSSEKESDAYWMRHLCLKDGSAQIPSGLDSGEIYIADAGGSQMHNVKPDSPVCRFSSRERAYALLLNLQAVADGVKSCPAKCSSDCAFRLKKETEMLLDLASEKLQQFIQANDEAE